MADARSTSSSGEAITVADDHAQPATSSCENTKLTVEFLQKTYWEGGNLVFKGTAFYIAILAGLVGYVITQKVQTRVAEFALCGGMATSVLALLVAIMSGRTIYRCVGVLERLLVDQADHSAAASELRTVFSRWRKTIWSFGVCGTLLVVMFVSGMLVLLNSLDQIGASRQQQSTQSSLPKRSVQQ
jgi:hypothetical protein